MIKQMPRRRHHSNTSSFRGLLAASFAVAGLLLVMLSASPAHARGKIPIPYHTGEDIFPTGALPAEYAENPELEGWSAGYKCEIWGVVWSYASIKNCTPVVFKDDQYTDAEESPELIAAVSQLYSEDDMQVGLWTKWGIYLLGLLVVGGIAMSIFGKDDD